MLLLVLLSLSETVATEVANCSSLVQRENARSRTSALEAEVSTLTTRIHETAQSYLSTMAKVLGGQKASSSGVIMFILSVLVTLALLVAGFLLMRRVQKNWQQPASSSVPGQPKVAGSARSVQRATRATGDLSPSRAQQALPAMCEDLVVPEGRECVLLVPKFTNNEISINDHHGKHVFIASPGEEEDVRCQLMSPSLEVFATIRPARVEGKAALAIHGPNEREFGMLKSLKNGDFELLGSGRCVRFQFSSGRLNVIDEDTRLMALSELADGMRQFRIGPRVDVGLVMACALGIEILQRDFR